MAGCDLHGEDERGEHRSKSEPPGHAEKTAKCQAEGRGQGLRGVGSSADEDELSLSSAPLVFRTCGCRVLCTPHHRAATTTPQALAAAPHRLGGDVHPEGGAGQGAGALARPSLALSGVRKGFSDLRQADPLCPELPDPLGSPVSPAGDLCLCLGEHVPVVLGLLA
ncbi:unnamed protein product [Rangifer tarandus platyrhynchus]|uniref:Uncharacterized protein n=2 Tax=Rangifer tarandus platyrhynchus TaxID=3082113 RepID=A0ABN8Y6E7_RANTA|nr:unnamed protein product [Rangifer tarandus platyrhynchus]CAI9693207.1 unnamed protein product [Rangifer tarandus platyrhynchus]